LPNLPLSQAIKEEREACARIADEEFQAISQDDLFSEARNVAYKIACRIRARVALTKVYPSRARKSLCSEKVPGEEER
jgi:GGDEF domain-containing protein